MKSFAALALIALFCVPAKAQMGGMGGGSAALPRNIETEILELEQEADKAALKEALLLHAKEGMKNFRGSEDQKKEIAEDAATLRDFIAKKKQAIKERADKLAESRTTGRPPAARPAQPPRDLESQDAVEGYEKAKVEVQLLQAQVGLLQPELTKAIDELAGADLAASTDPTRRDKADSARKDYEKLKARVVELNKQLYREQQFVLPMQIRMQSMGFGGMGGGGGGFR